MRTVARVLFYDVLLGLVYIASDAALAYFYFSHGHPWWGALTLGAVALPGTLECLSYTYSLLHGDLPGTRSEQIKEWLFWSVLFGPLLFPISLVTWHLVTICRGEETFTQFENIARSRVLSSLTVLTKSCMQLTLQATIMMITWYSNNDVLYHSYQLTSVCLSTLIIAKTCADHHYFEISGKSVKERSPYCQLISRLFLNLLHIACRGTVLALLAAYLHYLSLAFIGLMILTNLGLASCLLRTDGSKHLWTACAGVLLPNAFISRDTVEVIGRQKTRELFRRFYKVNSLVFLLVMGVGALVTCLCLITLTDFIQFNCTNLPFLSYDPVKNCPDESLLAYSLSSLNNQGAHSPHFWMLVAGGVGVPLICLIHVTIVFIGEAVLDRGYEPVTPL